MRTHQEGPPINTLHSKSMTAIRWISRGVIWHRENSMNTILGQKISSLVSLYMTEACDRKGDFEVHFGMILDRDTIGARTMGERM